MLCGRRSLISLAARRFPPDVGEREKAIRARDVEDFEKMNRIRSVDKRTKSFGCQPLQWTRYVASIMQRWHCMRCGAFRACASVPLASGDSAAVRFCQPESRIHFMRPWPSPVVDGKQFCPFFLTNARQLMDSPGEWYPRQP